MIKAIIVDDEPHGIRALSNALKIYCPDVELAGHADDIETGIHAIHKLQPELVFLDIKLGPKSTSFAILEAFPHRSFEIIFVTAFEEYAVQAIEHIPSGYIVKPIDPEKLQATVQKTIEKIRRSSAIHLLKQLRNQQLTISISDRRKIELLNISNIIRFESFGNDIIIHPANWEKPRKITNRTLNMLEGLLADYGFLRVQQSHLVNRSYIRTYIKGRNQLIMADESEVPVSNLKKAELIAFLLNDMK
jgi:two-component system LytT family response regulator